MCAQMLSHVQFFVTLWTIAHQTPLSMGFSWQEYRSRLSFPPPGDLPNQGSNPHLLLLLYWQTGSLPAEPMRKFQDTGNFKYGNYCIFENVFF